MTTNLDSQVKNDIRARELLWNKLEDAGVPPVALIIWQDTERAYLDDGDLIGKHEASSDVYAIAAKALSVEFDGEDTSDVNEALWDEYLGFCEVAAEQIENETKESEDVNDGSQRESWLHTWEGKDGYYFCFSGTTRDGLYSESDDIGPFESREEARENAMEHDDG